MYSHYKDHMKSSGGGLTWHVPAHRPWTCTACRTMTYYSGSGLCTGTDSGSDSGHLLCICNQKIMQKLKHESGVGFTEAVSEDFTGTFVSEQAMP